LLCNLKRKDQAQEQAGIGRMGDITPQPSAASSVPATTTSSHLKEIPFKTFDEVLLQRAVDADQTPLIAYPATKHGVGDYELFTGAQLNRLVDGAVRSLLGEGVEAVVRTTQCSFLTKIKIKKM
jgi:hypothetical protein